MPAARLILCLLVAACAQVFPCAGVETQAQEPPCPSIKIRDKSGSEVRGLFIIYTGVGATLTADVAGLTPADKPTFNWTISSGKIISGQGTSTATVLTDLDMGHELSVVVEVGGVSALGPQCEKRASGRLRVSEYFCPAISITCPSPGLEQGYPMTVSLNVSGGDPEVDAKYHWTVSAGKIVSGQGTPSITIDTAGLGGNNVVTATVEVGGFPDWCDRTESCSVIFESPPPPPRKFDSYGGLSWVKESSRLADFAAVLLREPGAQGYIFYYGPRRVDERLSRAQKFLTSKFGIDPERITGVNAGRSKKFAAQLWVRPTGSPEPRPEPRF